MSKPAGDLTTIGLFCGVVGSLAPMNPLESSIFFEKTADLPTFLLKVVELDAMNDDTSGVFFATFGVLKNDLGLFLKVAFFFLGLETLLVDLNLVKNGDTSDFFGSDAFFRENLFDDFFDENDDALLALLFFLDLNRAMLFVSLLEILRLLDFLDENDDAFDFLRAVM